jgi:hypothetical protein
MADYIFFMEYLKEKIFGHNLQEKNKHFESTMSFSVII